MIAENKLCDQQKFILSLKCFVHVIFTNETFMNFEVYIQSAEVKS